MRSSAPGAITAWTKSAFTSLAPAASSACAAPAIVPPVLAMSSTIRQAAAANVAEHARRHRDVRRGAGLRDDGERRGKRDGVALRALQPAGVRRDDRQVLDVPIADDRKHRLVGLEVHERHVERALERGRMELERHQPVDAGVGEEPRREARRARLAIRLAHVLARVAEVGHDRGDPRGAGGVRRVGEEGEGHQPLVRRRGGRLHDVEVRAGDVGFDADAGLAVGERGDRRRDARRAAQAGYGVREVRMRVARQEPDPGPVGHCGFPPSMAIIAFTPVSRVSLTSLNRRASRWRYIAREKRERSGPWRTRSRDPAPSR